jgi:hypothetical protein
MPEITAAAKLQAWLDGNGELSKADVRTVLWDLAEAQTTLAALGRTETEWSVAIHGQRSIQYGDGYSDEDYIRNEVREELEHGAVASVAFRTVGQWRHEDPEAQQHADALDAVLKRSAP